LDLQIHTTLDNRLDGLVDVVVDVLASNDGCDGVGVLGLVDEALILKELGLLSKTSLNLAAVSVLELAVLNSDDVVDVLLSLDFAVEDGLDGGVVVVLVDLLVDGGSNVLVPGGDDGLVNDGGCDALVDRGVMVSGLGLWVGVELATEALESKG